MTAGSIYKREARIYARTIGFCVHCLLREAVSGHSYCDPCMEYRAEYQSRRKAQWIADGLCSRCGHDREGMPGKWCPRCLKYSQSYKTNRQEAI